MGRGSEAQLPVDTKLNCNYVAVCFFLVDFFFCCIDYHIPEEYGVYITRQLKHLSDREVITQYLQITSCNFKWPYLHCNLSILQRLLFNVRISNLI